VVMNGTLWDLTLRPMLVTVPSISSSNTKVSAGVLLRVSWRHFQRQGIVSPSKFSKLKSIIHITTRFRELSISC
jgi:hypothetical protein